MATIFDREGRAGPPPNGWHEFGRHWTHILLGKIPDQSEAEHRRMACSIYEQLKSL
ncbi:hypothetical protein AFERRI_40108 [Acidithiobacillus ferrivorans]|uniref:Uncharacterized protein n=1 Tax=Acidithiobacillus ferrivorans TaxID=160808 RepID=A0A060UPF0_9PROT|nr:hypothetical protein AFERRI_40108 [Acidithiobacillus ferrivorans]